MSERELARLIDNLDLNPWHDLRRTRGRVERLRNFLRNSPPIMPPVPPVNPPVTPTTPSTPSAPTQQQLMLLAQANRMPTARFTGFVPLDVPNRHQLMSYDVTRWLCDTETRCQVKGITDDVLKIKEAKMAVAHDVGDAAIVLNTGRMNEVRSYATFKAKCLKFWRSASERDRYHALSDFLSVEFSTSMGVFAGNLERARARVLQDLQDDTSFQQGDAAAWSSGARSTETLVSLDEVINYLSWGVMFKAAPPSYREALRKVEVKYSDDYVDILSKVQSELCKKEKGAHIELSAHASSGKEFTNSNVRRSYQKRETKCFRCERQGHLSKECHAKLRCVFCKKEGHLVSKCYKKQRKSKAVSGGIPSNSHVVDAEGPDPPVGGETH